MNEQLLAAIEQRCPPYEIDFERQVISVSGFFHVPRDGGVLRSLTEEFPAEVLHESGLFAADSLQPLIPPGEIFLVLRNAAGAYVDLVFEGGSAADRFVPLQVLQDANFRNCRQGGGRVCFVDSFADMALLWAAGIRAIPGRPLLSATRSEMKTTLERLAALGAGQDARPLEVKIADWSIDRASHDVSPQWRAVLRSCNRLQKVATKQPSILLWRPSRRELETIQIARRHNPEWLVERLRLSFGQQLRGLSEIDRPLDDGHEMVVYKLRQVFQAALRKDDVCGGFDQLMSQREYIQAVVRSLQAEALPLAGDDSPQAARLLEAELHRYEAALKLPELLFVAAKAFRGNPHEAAGIVESPAFRELLEKVRASSKVARDILKD